jgi:hypothetical protein
MNTGGPESRVTHAPTLLECRGDAKDPGDLPIGGSWSMIASWLDRSNTPLTVVAALVAPVLYFLYLDHYAVNVLQGDDWNMVPLGVHQALHGHVPLGQLWSQYGESRIILVKSVIVVFAYLDQFNTRSMIFFNAVAYTAAYGIVLLLCHRYLGRRLTPIPVLVLGLVWFSLADVQSALWEFLMVDYLLVLFFVVMLFALHIPKTHRRIWLSVGILAAVLASLSFVSGFIVWPLGALSIVWSRAWHRRVIIELSVWVGVACVTAALYFWGFDWHDTGCTAVFGCTPNAALSHPLSGLRFFVVLTGNVIPGGYFGAPYPPHSYLRYELVGIAICLVVVYIVIQTWRQRETRERFPLPLLLVLLGVLMDAEVALGRTGGGLFSAINSNRYEFPNLILLSGIVVFAWGHLPSWRPSIDVSRSKDLAASLCVIAGVVLLGTQVVVATQFGLTNAGLERGWLTDGARVAVNLSAVPLQDRLCERAAYFLPVPATIREAAEDHLGEFAPNSYRFYRGLGRPTVPLNC